MGGLNMIKYNPNLKKMKLISGKDGAEKLLQTNSIQIPMLTGKQKKRKMAHAYRVKLSRSWN